MKHSLNGTGVSLSKEGTSVKGVAQKGFNCR